MIPETGKQDRPANYGVVMDNTEAIRVLRDLRQRCERENDPNQLNRIIVLSLAIQALKENQALEENIAKDETCKITEVAMVYGCPHCDKPIRERLKGEEHPELKNGEYQCEHAKNNTINAGCVWCELSLAEKTIDRLKKKPSLEELAKVMLKAFEDKNECHYVCGDMGLGNVTIDGEFSLLEISQAILDYLEKGGSNGK